MWRGQLGLRARVTFVYALGALLLTSTIAFAALALAQRSLLRETQRVSEAQIFKNADELRRVIPQQADAIREVPEDGSEPLNVIGRVLEDLALPNQADPLLILENNEPFSLAGLLPENIPADLRNLVISGGAGRRRFVGSDGQVQLAFGVRVAALDAEYYEVVPLNDLQATLNSLRNILVGVGFAGAVAGAGLGYYSARRALQPITQVAAAAEAIAAGDFDTRLTAQADPDLSKLSGTFNDMVGALRARIERDERFASDVSHELRSPLMTLAASVEVLENRQQEMPAAAQRATELLSKDLSRFQDLVEDLLEISRIDAGGVQLDLQTFRLVEFLNRVVAQSQTPDVPVRYHPVHANLTVAGDKRRLAQVFANLLDNSRKYGGGATEINVTALSGLIQVGVEDDGPGVPVQDRHRIFDRFSRAGADAGRRDVAKGVGLGLSLVSEHVRLHGGRVWVDAETRTGTGARFVVEIPEEPLEESDEEFAL